MQPGLVSPAVQKLTEPQADHAQNASNAGDASDALSGDKAWGSQPHIPGRAVDRQSWSIGRGGRGEDVAVGRRLDVDVPVREAHLEIEPVVRTRRRADGLEQRKGPKLCSL